MSTALFFLVNMAYYATHGATMKKLWSLAKLNKHDVIFLVIVVILAGSLYFALNWINSLSAGEEKVAIVTYQNKEVMRLDLNVDATYTYQATMGLVTIEVKDQAVRVEKETSPYHYCSLQGWVKSANTPIVCLPNELVITIKGVDSGNDVNLR